MSGVLSAVAGVLLILAAAEALLRWLDVADPPAFQSHPDFGYLMCPNQSVSTRGRRFRINNAGLRGADVASREVGEKRVVFVGDSITYGGGKIPDSDLFATRVSDSLSASLRERVVTVNLSAPGWGIENMAAFIAEKGVFDADVVVWTIPSADFLRRKTLLDDFGFRETRPRLRLVYAMTSCLVVMRKWHRRTSDIGAALPMPDRNRWVRNLSVLRATLSTLKAAGIAIVVVAIPNERGYAGLEDCVRELESMAQASGVAFIDVAPVFQARQDLRLFEDGVHLSSDGHTVVADAILPALRPSIVSSGPVSCQLLNRTT